MAIRRNAPDRPPPPANPETGSDLYRACEQYRDELRRFLASQAHSNVVDDLMQEICIRLLRTRPTEPIQDPRLYMYRVAWNELHRNRERWWQDRKRQSLLSPLSLKSLSETTRSLWVDDSSEEVEKEELAAVLEELPVVWRVAFLRKNRDGHSYKEIAAELRVTPHTVKKYIGGTLDHLRQYFIMSKKIDSARQGSGDEI